MYLKMKISALLFAVFVLLGVSLVDAAKVEVIEVPSAKMEKKIPATVILPDAYSERKSEKFAVLYLLHGAGGNHASWNQSTQCAQLADKYEFIILCCFKVDACVHAALQSIKILCALLDVASL